MKIIGALAVVFFLCSPFSQAEKADLVLKNAVITTMNSAMPEASALAIRGDRIVRVGSDKEVSVFIGPQTHVLDLNGKFVYPGFIDSHAHIRNLGSLHLQMDFIGTPDKAAVLKMVRDGVAKIQKGEWVLGRGWDQNDWPEKSFPTASDLDAITPDNPAVLERVDGHAYWVNSNALKLAGITTATKDPDGGKILRDAAGKPTGILVDNAMDLVDSKMTSLTIPEIIQRTRLALQDAVQKGITMIHDASSMESDLQAWKELAAKDQLPVRIYSMVWMPSEFGESYLKTGPQHYGPYLDVRSLKMIMDGAMGSRGAAMLAPYSDDPGNKGLLRWKEEDLLRVLRAAKEKGIQVGIHAIGDRANHFVLDAYEKVGVKGLRWRIEHAQILTPGDIPRFAQMGIIASMQPTHATSDMPWATDRVGPERIKGAYAWRSLLDLKTVIAGGSDAPVEDINPLWGIYSAITRQDHEGKPEGGWHPEQLVSRQEALKMFTVNAAYSAFRENELGMLKTGYLADLVVLPENLLTCPPKDMIEMKVLQTIVGGKTRYDAANAPSAALKDYIRMNDPVIALQHVNVIDGTGAPAKNDQTIVIENGKIASIGTALTPPENAKVVDLSGYSVIPGLVGMHDHLFYPAPGNATAGAREALFHEMGSTFPRLYLACGVTAIRTTGSIEPYTDLELKRFVDGGEMPGPKIHLTGPYLEGAGSFTPQLYELKNGQDAAKVVNYWADLGATSFKAYMHITRDELSAAIAAAHKRGLKVTGHLCSIGFREAAQLGIDDLEHGLFVDTEFYSQKKTDVCPSPGAVIQEMVKNLTDAQMQETIAELIKRKVAVTSTLPVFELLDPTRPDPGERTLSMMNPLARENYLSLRKRAADPALLKQRYGTDKSPWTAMFKKGMQFEYEFAKAGGLLLAGCDPTGNGGVVAGFADQREVELLVEAGFTPLEAIRIATLNGAIFLGEQNTIGSIATGKQADLVIIKGDPSKDIKDIENVEIVFKDGVGYDSAKLLESVKGLVGLR